MQTEECKSEILLMEFLCLNTKGCKVEYYYKENLALSEDSH